ncbi:hypothetical protein [Chitinimonas sp. BJYL2]|uniref:hypothetical protein n=1 Tax=Chitinimonas sp. BJYL2 TaxID=2976696 RepID=UPI0022B3B42C|nr:hypothetical protein [Chitinimonas sp. BJYL2]
MLIRLNIAGWRNVMGVVLTGLLAACGGGAPDTGSSGGTPPVLTPTLSVSVLNAANASSQTLYIGESGTATVKLLDSTGKGIGGAIVSLSIADATLGALDAGTVLTDANGIASTRLSAPLDKTGATTLSAAVTVGSSALSSSYNFAVKPIQLTLSPITLGLTAIQPGGSVGVSVELANAETGQAIETPATVTFTSPCVAANRASIDSPVSVQASTEGGKRVARANATYQDNGCTGSDKITATATLGASTASVSTSPDLQIQQASSAPASLEFVSAVPANISLAGIGGTTVSAVTFKLSDNFGNPVANQTVNFSLNSSVGGITLTQSSGITQADGTVQARVNAGSVSTVVRVTASLTVNGNTISSQSSQLTISTGVPHQNGFSLAASVYNPEFLERDGEEITLTVQSADRFGNPVPDGTPVSFSTEGGIGIITPQCQTTNGTCSVTLRSGGNRGALVQGGRQTILAHTVGEESFSDVNGNGVFDPGEPFTDLGEAFINADESNHSSPKTLLTVNGQTYVEPFIDFNSNSAYTPADGQYNGLLRSNSVPSTAPKTVSVRDSLVIVWAGSTLNEGGSPVSVPTLLCSNGVTDIEANITPIDINGNPIPAGSTITFEVTPSTSTTTGIVKVAGGENHTMPSTNMRETFRAKLNVASPDGIIAACPADSTQKLLVKIKTPNRSEVTLPPVTIQ